MKQLFSFWKELFLVYVKGRKTLKKKDDFVIEVPDFIQTVLANLATSGHEGYIVGGCVRDSIKGRTPKDWDVTTSALPEQAVDCFKGYNVIPTGLKHGTVTVMVDGNPVEITTFRTDGAYEDHRRPSEVAFTSSLEADLARRDFTMNSVAYNPEKGLVDVYGGKKDIEDRVIKCVGDPLARFEEDALRILRALRFAATFSFEIEKGTEAAMFQKKELLKFVSWERIRDEFSKILVAHDGPRVLEKYRDIVAVFIPEIQPMFDLKQRTDYHKYDVWKHTISTVQCTPDVLLLRLAAFFHDIGKPAAEMLFGDDKNQFKGHPKISGEITEDILRRLRFDNELIQSVIVLVRSHDFAIPQKTTHMKRILNRIGEKAFYDLLTLRQADIFAQADQYRDERVKDIDICRHELFVLLRTKPCFSLKDLAVNGHDMMAMGFKGEEIGQRLRYYLNLVILDKCENTKEALLSYNEAAGA